SIPIAFAPVGGVRRDILLQVLRATVDAGPCGAPIKINSGDVGYYRVQYDGETLAALTRDFQRLTPEDRINLLADTKALADAGRVPAAQFLAVADAVAENDHRAVWDEVIRGLAYLEFLERGRPGRAALQAYARSRLRSVFERLGWDARPGETV